MTRAVLHPIKIRALSEMKTCFFFILTEKYIATTILCYFVLVPESIVRLCCGLGLLSHTRGVGTHSRLGGPNSSRRHHGWRRAKNFFKIRGSRSLEMAISEPYLPISVRTVSWLSETCSAFF